MEVLKALGSTFPLWLALLLLVLTGMALFVWPRTRRFARHWLLWVTGTYVVFGLPVVANAIAGALPASATTATQVARPANTLIVLDGDNRRGRLAETVRLLQEDAPAVVWILGGAWFFEEIETQRFDGTTFMMDELPANTREQMDWVRRYVWDNPDSSPVLIVSRLQAPRVAALARTLDLNVAILASPVDDEPATAGWQAWVPSYVALRLSRDALYEHAAIRWYRWKGWI